jgi:hypothetical protein
MLSLPIIISSESNEKETKKAISNKMLTGSLSIIFKFVIDSHLFYRKGLQLQMRIIIIQVLEGRLFLYPLKVCSFFVISSYENQKDKGET